MSLFCATLLFGIFLICVGAPFLARGVALERAYFKALRSPLLAGIFFGGGGLWFLWLVAHLGKADFGDYRGILTLLFGVLLVGSFFWVRDFLAVRGFCLTYFLCAAQLLDAAYAVPACGKALFVGSVYAGVLVALYWAAVPFKAREFGYFLFRAGGNTRSRTLGAALVVLGAANVALAFFY